MTKKDYVKAAKIANTLRTMATTPEEHAHFIGAMTAFVALFRDDNPNFDETKFRQACKGEK